MELDLRYNDVTLQSLNPSLANVPDHFQRAKCGRDFCAAENASAGFARGISNHAGRPGSVRRETFRSNRATGQEALPISRPGLPDLLRKNGRRSYCPPCFAQEHTAGFSV